MDLNINQRQILNEFMRLNPNMSKEKATQLLFGPNAKSQGNITLSNTNNTISFSNLNGKKVTKENLFGSNTNSSDSLSNQFGKTIFSFFDKNGDGIIKDDNTGGVNEMQLMLTYIQTYAGTDGNLNDKEALKMIKDIDTYLDNSGAVSDLEKASASEMLGFVKAVDTVKEDVTTHPQTVASTSAVPTYEDFTTEEIQLMAVQTLKEEVQTSMGLYNSFKSGAVSDLFGDDDDPLSKRNQYYRRYWSEKTRCKALELAQAGMLTEVDYRKMQIELIQDYLSLEPDNPNLQWAEQQAAQLLEQSLLTMDTKDLTRLVANLTELSEADFEQAVTSYKLPYIKEAEKRQNNNNLPNDVTPGCEPLKIPFSEETYQQSYSRNMDFGEVWGLEFAEKFNPQDMVNFHYKKSECMIIAAADQRLSPIISQLQEYINNPHTRGIDDSKITSLLLEAQGILGLSSQQGGSAYSQAISEFGGSTPAINLDGVNFPQQSDHYAYNVNSDLLNQAKNMLELLQAKYDSILGDKTLEQYQNELTATYQEAFGDFESSDDLINLANAYVQDKQETLDNVKVGVNIFGGALVIAGTLVTGGVAGPVLMGSGIALSVAGSPGVSALEGATREGGLTKEDIEAIKQELTQNALLTVTGMGIGKMSGAAYQALVIKNMCPRLVALSAEIGIDATASLLTDLVITGQIDLNGEGIAQLVNILVGIAHSKGNLNQFLDTHAGNVINTNEHARINIDSETPTRITAATQQYTPSTRTKIEGDTRVVETLDTRGNVTVRVEKDAQGRILSTTEFEYDKNGNLTRITNYEGNKEATRSVRNQEIRDDVPWSNLNYIERKNQYERIKSNLLNNVIDDPNIKLELETNLRQLDGQLNMGASIDDLLIIIKNLENHYKNLRAYKPREKVALSSTELRSMFESAEIQDNTIREMIEDELKSAETLTEATKDVKLIEIEEMIYAIQGLEGQSAMLSDYSASGQSPAASSANQRLQFTDTEIEIFAQSLKFDGVKNYIDSYAETNPKMTTYLYDKYLETLPQDLQTQCREIANKFGTRIFVDSSYPNNKQILDEISQELQVWQTAGNGELKLPRVLDEYNLSPLVNKNHAISWANGSISINLNTLHDGVSVAEIIRHEIVHANDPNIGTRYWDNKNNPTHAQFNQFREQYKTMMLNAGISPEMVEYGLSSPRELVAVACASGDHRVYSQEFKDLLVHMGAPKELFDMPPVGKIQSTSVSQTFIYPKTLDEGISIVFPENNELHSIINQAKEVNLEFKSFAENLYKKIFVDNAHETVHGFSLTDSNKAQVFRDQLLVEMPEPARSQLAQNELLTLFDQDPEFQKLLNEHIFSNEELSNFATRAYCRDLVKYSNRQYTKNGYAQMIREKLLDKLPNSAKANYIKNMPEYDNLTPTGLTIHQEQIYDLFKNDPEFQAYLEKEIFSNDDLTAEAYHSYRKYVTARSTEYQTVNIANAVKTEIIETSRINTSQNATAATTPEQSLATIMESNPNVRNYASRNSGDSPISQEITTYLEQNPQYGQEIVDYMSIQRRRPNDTKNPTEHLGTYIQTLYEFPQHKEFITALANDPNLDGQAIRNIITERGNNLTDQLKSDILLIASKGHDTQGINFYLRMFEQNPEFRANFTAEVPQFVLIDNSTPTAKVQKQRNTIISKINNTCPQALQTLKQTLGEDYFNKIKWEDIIPENATAKEITKTIEYLNDCSKFFSRISTNEERYGKNLVWAHSMNVISENAQIKIADGGNFDDVIYGIANEYRFYDVSTTLATNNVRVDGGDRRLSSGVDRSTNPDYYRSSTSFNQDNYGNYFERFMSVNSQEIEMPYDDIKKTFILPLDKDSGAMIHPDPSTIRATMKHAADAYNNLQPLIQKAQSGQKLSAEEIQQFHNNAAEIYYLVAHAMPWERGSNGIADIFMRSIYSSANIDLPALKPGVSLDLEAFCVDLKTYQQNWLNFFE